VKRWIFLVLGGLLLIVGIVWISQGLGLLGQSGGMNGESVWGVIGLVAAIAGLGFLVIGARAGRSAANQHAPR
jgi:hypothetical protein